MDTQVMKDIEEATLQNNAKFLRQEALQLYKAWKVTPDDSRLLQKYSQAWMDYQDAHLAYFLFEAES